MVKDRLLELLEAVPHAQRLYPDLYVDMLIENGVTIPVQCVDCIHWKERTVNKKGFIVCSASGMEIFTDDYCSHGERKSDGTN